jgi:GT2 family glycosyltransferase
MRLIDIMRQVSPQAAILGAIIFCLDNLSTMTTISINLLRWSTPWEEVQQCVAAVLDSDFKDFELTYMENPHPSAPSLMDEVKRRFGGDNRLSTVQNDSNLGYAGAHNRFFAENDNELVMVLNPDAVLDSLFLQNIIKPFSDPAVGAVTGKMLKHQASASGERILDGTGIEIYRSRRARELGQLEPDHGQYDYNRIVFGVSGTAAVYRKAALEAIKLGEAEYFDPDFFAYWEDFDLSWRLRLRGFECVYVPEAVVEHGRAAGASPGGFSKFSSFVKHQRSLPLSVRQWDWRNHLFAIIKNDFGRCFYRDLPRIFVREAAMQIFILFFMPDTLSSIPKTLSLLPRMLRKRMLIQSSRTISSSSVCSFFK